MSTFGTTIGSGGLAFYDANHIVSYNYVQGVYGGNFQGPLLLDSGDTEGASSNTAGHWRVVNARVERNILVGDPEGIRYGNNFALAPTGCVVQDNVVAQDASGTAETVLVAPVNTTRINNTYASTPAGVGLSQGSDTIWRKTSYGPRLTYLRAADVGVGGDVDDTDGTGVLIPGFPTPGPVPDPTSAAYQLGWGNPLAGSDEFIYAGTPDTTKWSVYNGPGHAGNGLRSPSRVTVDGSKMVLTGLGGSADTAGLAHRLDQTYGRWEVRCRSYYTGNPTDHGTQSGGYHPVLIVWPTSDSWPRDGEYDFLENGEPGMLAAGAFMHYPSLDGSDHQIDVPDYTVDLTQFHNFAFEWAPTGVTGWVDGVRWFSYSGGAASDRKNIQDMPAGHLTVQLDATAPTGMIGSTFEVEWVRVYSLTPSAPPSGPQTVTVTGIASREALGFPVFTGGETAPPSGSEPTLLGSANCILGIAALGYTPTGGGGGTPPPGSVTVSGAGNIASGQALGAPVVSIADGPLTVNAIGLVSAETFGSPTVTGGTPPTPAPGGVLVPALFAVGADGSTLTPLPAWTKVTVSPVRNSPGAITVEYPAGAQNFQMLHDGVSANPLHALEIKVWLGGNATGALGGWLVQKSGDDLTPGSTWTFSGHFHEWLLQKALIAPQPIINANDKGELRFAAANAGLILGTIMDQAKGRGALPLVTRDFSSTRDSNGQPWAQSISSMNLAPRTTVAQVADKLVELGLCEYEITAARVWRAYNPGTRGKDKAVGLSPLTFAQATNLSERSRRESAKDAGTAVLAAGSQGFYQWASSATAQAELGWRAEVAYDAGQVSSQAGIQAAAATDLEIIRHGVAEYDGAIEFTPGSPLPLIDYGIGDWAYVVAGTTRTKLRIAQLGITFAPGRPPSGTVALNDLITDKLSALYRRLNAITTGDAVVGTSTPTPGGTGDDFNPPAAPTGVVVASNTAYRVSTDGTIKALVSVGWAAVTTNAYPDNDTAGKAKAAGYIVERIRSRQTIAEDWTWNNMPTVVGLYHGALIVEAQASGLSGNNWPFSAAAVTWLAAYPTAHLGGGAVADDIASYHVQYSYLGGTVVGTVSPTPDWVIPRDPNDPAGTGVDYSWAEPIESPTTGLTLTFGDAVAGRAVSVRVAAVDRAGNQSPWSAVVGVVTAGDDTPPPAPSKPIVKPWYRTMDIEWDGNGSAGEDMRTAAPDLNGVEVHVSTGASFIPDRPLSSDGQLDPARSGTFKTMLYTAGTSNVTGLTIGVTYFARFVAVDDAGNASPPSAVSDGVVPQQLVNIDIGPNAIARQQIIDGEIVRAKIADLAVNDAKIADLSVGKITAGTMVANVILGGRFTTPTSNNNHIELDSAGLRLYQGNSVVGRWSVFDASMLMTGQFQTRTTGQRIVMNPGGANADTMRFYPTFSDVYSSITAFDFGGGTIAGIQIVGSGTDQLSNRGQLLIRDQYASLVHGRTDLSYWGSEIWVEQAFTRNKSATVDLIVDMRLTPVAGPRRVAMIHYDTAGAPMNATGLYYGVTTFNGGEPHFYANGQDVGLVFAPGKLYVRDNPNAADRDLQCRTFTQTSGRALKRDEHDLDVDSVDMLRVLRPKQYRWNDDPDDAPERIGFIAEDMPRPIRVTDVQPQTDGGPPRVDESIDYNALTTVLCAAVQRIEARLSAMDAPLGNLSKRIHRLELKAQP